MVGVGVAVTRRVTIGTFKASKARRDGRVEKKLEEIFEIHDVRLDSLRVAVFECDVIVGRGLEIIVFYLERLFLLYSQLC